MMHGVLFDLDGLLIDSEPLWRRAEVRVFGALGVALTEADCAQTMGLRLDDVVAFWRARQPWAGPADEAVAEAIVDEMLALVAREAVPMPGALEAVDVARAAGLPVAVATSAPRRLVPACLRALDLHTRVAFWHSAQDEPLGKPHPAVYLTAAARLGVPATACLAVEDSLTGLVAAKAARMAAAVVPAPEHRGDPRFTLADWRLGSLHEFGQRVLGVVEGPR
ncbi:MAG: hexitol phosphatase HxpB [Myxococcales bacterium]|nr:hexitol phosphatase HxpB [Myxococcales bacterium]